MSGFVGIELFDLGAHVIAESHCTQLGMLEYAIQ